LSSGAWRAAAGVVGLLVLAAVGVGGVRLLFLPGPAPTARPPKEPAPLTTTGLPPKTVAPFDAAQATQFQKGWADYLCVPVVREVDLGGKVKVKMTLIPPGTFQMGSPEGEAGHTGAEGPQHSVEITRPFYLGVYPVTKGQFTAFVRDDDYQTEAEKAGDKATWRKPGVLGWAADYAQTDDDPVVEVSWNDAAKFCEWLGKKVKGKCELPTEGQWEYACRAGMRTAYFFGGDPKTLDDYAWYGEIPGHTHPAGGKKPNPWGLFDMGGNVWQWCKDYQGYYSSGDVKDPIRMDKASSDDRVFPLDARVFRGGSWCANAENCRAAYRRWDLPGSRYDYLGFRVCFHLD